MKPGMFGMIPYEVMIDKSLSDGDKLMYAFIQAHADKDGKCKEDEKYFAEARGVDPRTIRSQISRLVHSGNLFKKKNDSAEFILEIPTQQYFVRTGADPVSKTTKQILDYWNSVLNTEIVYTTLLERYVKRRLEKVTPEQLVRAVQGRIAFIKSNTWFSRDENRSLRSNITLLLQSDDEVAKYLNYEITDLSLVTINHEAKVKSFDTGSQNKAVTE